MKTSPPVNATSAAEVEKKSINPELWQACAGPLVNLPVAGTHVVYFPQGHSEQVAASMKKDVDAQIPNYPNLPSKLLCLLHNVTLHADPETDEVYAQMTLQPIPSFDKEALLRSEISMKSNKPEMEFFCKTLTASDTSTHGGFSVPRRSAEKIFPSLDFSMQPPAQELMARDLHDNVWNFRHIFRGQPKRHLLTTGWSLFVSGKRLFAGDSVLFIRDEKQQLLLGTRRANRQPTNLSSSVLSSDSMHIGILAAAAHAAANNSPFTVFYNPRASPSEFVVPLAKYYKAVCSNQISLGMRFRMMFETEESGKRRYMGTITGISDLDPVRWKNSQWRNLNVGWDESTTGERRNRVSIWEIEPVTAPFFICPTQPSFFRSKRPRQPGMPDDDSSDLDNLFRRTMPWIGDEFGVKDQPGFSLVQWMNMQQNPSLNNSMQQQQPNYMNSLPTSTMQNISGSNMTNLPSNQISHQNNSSQFNTQRPNQPSPSGSITQPQTDTTQFSRQNSISQPLTASNQVHNVPQQQQISSQSQMSDSQLQLLQKLHHQQQQSILSQQSTQIQDQLHVMAQQMMGSNTQTNLRFAPPPQQTKIQTHHPTEVSGNFRTTLNNQFSGGGGQSALTDDVPSCSTSPSANLTGLETVSSNGHMLKDLQAKSDMKPVLNIPKSPNRGFFASQTHPYYPPPVDYLDSSSSATSVLSQNDVQIHQNNNSSNNHNPMCFNSQSMNNVPFGGNIGTNELVGIPMINESLVTKEIVGPGKDFSSDGVVLSSYENPKEAQPELVSPSFGVPDIAFNSIDSTINDAGFMNGGSGAWGAPQVPRLRTYTKVYKRGAVGRSIDIMRYSGYDELKQDLARRFGIEGQLEDRQRVGWKLVYVDHENDVLLVGDDPWEEFLTCVRCIKILSPQEVQQMSLDGDFGNNVLQNQVCSSSDNGVN